MRLKNPRSCQATVEKTAAYTEQTLIPVTKAEPKKKHVKRRKNSGGRSPTRGNGGGKKWGGA